MTAVDTPRAKCLALALLAMTQFVVVLDAAIVNVALPSIGRALDFSQDNLAWVVNAYTLTFGGFLLLGGRLADLLGRRRLFMIGLVVFSLASLARRPGPVRRLAHRRPRRCRASAPRSSPPPRCRSSRRRSAEGAERNRALGVWGAVAGSGGAAGVLLGGMLTEWAGWEWVLFVNVPIGVAAALLAPRLLPESRDDVGRTLASTSAARCRSPPASSLLVYTLVDAKRAGWASTQTLGLGAVSLVILAAFVVVGSRARASRSCRSRSSGCRRCAAPTSSACSSACRSSRCSSSSPSTCSRCWATTR